MKHAQKTQRATRKVIEEPEVQATDVKDEDLAEQTGKLLEELDCCLAEASEETNLKRQAKTEWDANEAAWLSRSTTGFTWDDYWHAKEAWIQKYREVVTMERDCCGDLRPNWDK